MARRRAPKAVLVLEQVKRDGRVERIVDEPNRVGYVIFKPENGKRKILVFRRMDNQHLKQPVEVWISADLREEDYYVIDYIIQSICRRTPRLLPFALGSEAVKKLCRYLLLYRSGSLKTLWIYVYCLYRLSKYFGKSPDELIREAYESVENLRHHTRLLEEYLLLLKARGASSGYVDTHAKAMKALYRANDLKLELSLPVRNATKYYYRAPTPEELQRLLEHGSLREKVIVSMLALGGFRLGTLVRLKYRHVKRDLEAGKRSIHIHVEAEITKGKYCDYDTFIGNEAVEFLKLYLEQRRRKGEVITDESPLIVTSRSPPRPLTEQQIYIVIHRLYKKAGLIRECEEIRGPEAGRRYDLRAHSLRKFFRTQLTARGVPTEYVEYMMGHKVSRYNDIKSLGPDFLRKLYEVADLSIRPKPLTQDQIIRLFQQALGDIARRAGVSLGEARIEPAAYTETREPETEVEKLSLELEAILKHMVAKMLEREVKS